MKWTPTGTLDNTHTLFRAFADPTRLRLLNLLLDGEVCVCDLCDVLQAPQPGVSRHLAYLRRAGLVTVRSAGKWKHYSAVGKPPRLQRTLLQCVRDCRRAIPTLREDLKRLAAVGASRSCC